MSLYKTYFINLKYDKNFLLLNILFITLILDKLFNINK